MPTEIHKRISRDSRALHLPDGARTVEALECRIGRTQFAIPTPAIDRIVEYRTWPLPLAKAWIGGLSLHGGVPLVSVALRRMEDGARRAASMKAILLKVPTSPLGWALEVDEVFGFVRAGLVERGERENGKLPQWVSPARSITTDARQLWFVDVPAMLADLADVEVGEELQ